MVNQTAWRQTLEEADKGYIWPDKSAGAASCVLAKRFGLVQKEKIRMRDDCSKGGFNKTIRVVEKYCFHSIDEISAMLAWMLDYQKERHGGLSHDIRGVHTI